MSATRQISKLLSANDVGETGGHQAGILIPKQADILSFFPTLDAETKNPRSVIQFTDSDGVTRWKFNFIYYNNRFFDGTRNEYRLTGMTAFLRRRNAHVGDTLVFTKHGPDGNRAVEIRRARPVREGDGDTLVLAGGWKIIKI